MAYSGPDEPAGGYLDDSTSQIELLLGSEDDGRAFARIKEHGRRRAWTVQRCYRCLENLLRDLLLHQRRRFRCRASSPAHTLWLLLKILIFLVGGFVLVSVVQAILHPSYQRPPEHYAQLQRRILASSGHGRANQKDEKIFIAANIIREDLIRGAWGASLLELVDLLGEDNVFVSVYENDSGKATSEALIELQDKLPCNSSVVAGDHLRLSELPTTTAPGGKQRIKRIAYLAEVRNRALRPLDATYTPTSAGSEKGFRHATEKFDRVLFLNDVYFSATDVVQLLFSTNAEKTGHADYRAACAIDFTANVMFYDTFVVRDNEGYGMGLMFFPWFPVVGKSESRQDVLAEKDAVRVRSCWGGMASFDAQIFQKFSGNHSELALTFRHEPEPFWEAAECCLIFADMESTSLESNGAGVYINPYIRVAYTENTWVWLDFFRRYERIFANLQWIVSKIGYPEYNPRRLHNPGQMVKEKVWVQGDDENQLGSFQMLERKAAVGGFCGQRRMFVMKDDINDANKKGEKNWEKIPVPTY
ncbi:hypothetical protein H112_04599 [Trichophyton rubrum D6]|uniref:Uncharacterized protein n=3 Tax=Trichophyton rubrum TaxID=5551 RepID=A0A178F383_TRIRU|nr:uncharacterized protein TERG_04369 [Trichophyton rubrum CBS 118892]EZF22537.1 hypothetical protein H100_04606 [Trichophyton rubrum MR850]EZF41580.1 hypothetical protein H102_04593 [Trichophyton rubrum CBS 100081]EZF52174.1 hypothetical protein H103_04600 [Trichophyton rubrum CBS 288.86]EZF62852.1 hypothetical protein H104_04588 [Trichophyton rubrum CBS 289.86]EZF84145.1 hypothetical protein H110_04594 [Trichophyton rubrum MR1448]EZF94868.1 hypothetical protein H113_04634 [Trichophyton rubr